MKRTMLVASLALAVGALGAPASAAADDCCGRHHGRGHHGCGHHGCTGCPACDAPAAGRQQAAAGQRGSYDSDAVTTLKGKVKAVTVVPARRGWSGGTHVTLESDGAATDVHLGPTWFLEREGLKLAAGDALEVTGSLLDDDGNAYLVAREVKKGTALVRLRDERGTPAWAGGPRRD